MLPQGFHAMSTEDLRSLCVETFPKSRVRSEIMAGFMAIYEGYVNLKIEGELWIDGSFLTTKIDPDDIDFIALIPQWFRLHGTVEQQSYIEWMISKEDEPRALFMCHTEVLEVVEDGHADYNFFLDMKNHWEKNVYGFSVKSHDPKGIAVIPLAPPPVDSAGKGETIKAGEVAS